MKAFAQSSLPTASDSRGRIGRRRFLAAPVSVLLTPINAPLDLNNVRTENLIVTALPPFVPQYPEQTQKRDKLRDCLGNAFTQEHPEESGLLAVKSVYKETEKHFLRCRSASEQNQ